MNLFSGFKEASIRSRFWWLVAVFLVILAFELLFFKLFVTRAVLEVELSANPRANFQVFWAKEAQYYSETRENTVKVKKGRGQYQINLADLTTIEKLRIDPGKRPGTVLIKNIRITQPGSEEILFNSENGWGGIKALNHIQDLTPTPEGLRIVMDGEDAQLELKIGSQQINYLDYVDDILLLLLVALLLTVLLYGLQQLGGNYDYVPYLMCVVAGLILTMAVISDRNEHPDEYIHLQSARYYKTHWKIPSVCAPGTEDTYSPYGGSRLNGMEIVYYLAGKTTAVLSIFPCNDYIRARLFNAFLFFILTLLCIKTPAFRVVCLPLLVSPQIWYVFSYFNSEAFAIFICFIIAYLIIRSNGLTTSFNSTDNQASNKFFLFASGLALAMLYMVKKNFYVFGLFAALYMLHYIWFNGLWRQRVYLKRLGVVLASALVIVGGRYGLDLYLNGTDRAKKTDACEQRMAHSAFKSSTDKNMQYPGLNLKSKGVTIKEMFSRHHWGEKTFRSAFGVYGYLSIPGPSAYYEFVRVVGLAALATLFVIVLVRSGWQGNTMSIIFITSSFMLIGLSFFHAWTKDFQAQGRYLFPLIPMWGLFLYAEQRFLNRFLLNCFVLMLFTLSIYSFTAFGLTYIPRW